jgi:nucleotide-binding universal stress UspA family protein
MGGPHKYRKGDRFMKEGSNTPGSGGRAGRNDMKYVLAYSPDNGGRAALAAARLFSSAEVVLTVCTIIPETWSCPNTAARPADHAEFLRGPAAKALDGKPFLGDEVDAVYLTRAARSPTEGTFALVAELDAGMMVLGPARGGPPGRFTMGNVNSSLVHAAQVPTVLTALGYHAQRGVRLQQITYGYDGPRPSETPLATATEFALRHGVTLPMLVTGIDGGRLETLHWENSEALVIGSSGLSMGRLFHRPNGSKIMCNAPVPTVVVPGRGAYPLSISRKPSSPARHRMPSEPVHEATSDLPLSTTRAPRQSCVHLREPGPRYYAARESAYHCPTCEVEGRDLDPEPVCWSCGGPAVVTSRPLVHTPGPSPDKSAVTPRNGHL